MSNLEWLDGLGLDRTNLPQLPQQAPELLGRLEANNDGLPQLPQLAPTENNGDRAEKGTLAPGEGADREIICAEKTDLQEAWAAGFLACWQLLIDGRLLVLPAQQSGQECHGCGHLTMTTEHWLGTRRKFFWRCDLGHMQLETGRAGERIIIAPADCTDYDHL